MAKKMLIDATHAEETRIVVADGTRVDDFDFETVNKRQLAGNIYLAKVTRVEPSLQAAFVDYGGNRHGFLAFAEIHPDYYQIPAADRRALIEEDRAAADAEEAEANARDRRAEERQSGERQSGERRSDRGRRRGRRGDERATERAERAALDPVTASDAIPGMEIGDALEADAAAADIDAAVESGFAAAGGDVVDVSVEGQGGDADAPEPAPSDAPAVGEPEDEADIGADDGADDRPDHEIETVAVEDVTEDIRPARKPRARRYKIQEVIKVRQIMLVQVVKEERGNKGAALTTYLSLAGRYCVLMPNTARGGGISRKITSLADRKKLKEIAADLEVPHGAGLIIRTAGSQRTKTEIKRDYEYLMRLWEQIRELTFKSMAPAPIYEEGDLIKRSIRDLFSKDIDEVWVEGERGYRTAKDFMAMIMPDQVRAVKHYTDPMPLFARYQVEGYLSGMFNPTVQLKSGGYIVIGITEALVAIDVNSGRATKEGSIEDTAFKTNCEAADEIARQLRLRDLAGLIVIDFIDMDERKNNASVEKRFKEALANDRARIQVGRISGFGLMEMSRQRLRPGMLESTTQPCAHCHGTGLIRSDDTMALTILRAIEEEGTRKRSREVLVKAPVAVANFLMNQKRDHVTMIETRFGLSVRVEADPTLISPDFALEKFKTATRQVAETVSSALSVDASLMAQIDEAEDAAELDLDPDAAGVEAEASEPSDRDARPEGDEDADGRGRRRRRRRRRSGRAGDDAGSDGNVNDSDEAAVETALAEPAVGEPSDDVRAPDDAAQGVPAEGAAGEDGEGGPRRRRRRRRRSEDEADALPVAAMTDAGPVADHARDVAAGDDPVQPAAADADADASAPVLSDPDAPAAVVASPEQETAPAAAKPRAAEPEAQPAGEAQPAAAELGAVPDAEPGAGPEAESQGEPVAQDEDAPVAPSEAPSAGVAPPEAAPDAPPRPKRRGWWSQG